MSRSTSAILGMMGLLTLGYIIFLQDVLHRVKETKEECVHKCYHYQQNLISLKEDSVWLHSELEDLRKENSIFTSMLGEIENEPHGHEILKTLWDKMGKADIPDGNN